MASVSLVVDIRDVFVGRIVCSKTPLSVLFVRWIFSGKVSMCIPSEQELQSWGTGFARRSSSFPTLTPQRQLRGPLQSFVSLKLPVWLPFDCAPPCHCSTACCRSRGGSGKSAVEKDSIVYRPFFYPNLRPAQRVHLSTNYEPPKECLTYL